MAKIQIIYDSSQEVELIINTVQQHVDLKKEESEIYSVVQKIIQSAFDEGRRMQKQLNISSNVKDSVCSKADI